MLSLPEYDLVVEDREGGVYVAQHGRSYIGRKWQLNEPLTRVIDLALKYGLTCLWQYGHPKADTSHHISFSFSHEPASWIFCVGGEANPPNVRVVTVSKKVRAILADNGLDAFWESAGGKNFSLAPEKLETFLGTVSV